MENPIALSIKFMYICIFYMLTLPAVNVSDYSDLPEHYVINVNSLHIQVNHGLLYKLYGSNVSSQEKCSTVHSTRVPLFLHLGSILLLACGDVHPCPGPNYKYPCGVCHKPVKVYQKGILCDTCVLWYHTKCINMTNAEYFRLADNVDEPWECPDCQFPYRFTDSFFNISGDESFANVSVNSTESESVQDKDIFSEFYELKRKYSRKFIVCHININSLQFKHGELSILLRNKVVDCLFVSETKLNDSHLDSQFKVDGYTLYRNDNQKDSGGGLLCFIRSDIPSYCLKPPCGLMEALQINCVFNKQRWSLLCAYKKPSVSQSAISEDLDKVIDQSLNICDKYIVLGDLNCDMLKLNNNAVSRLCQDYNLTNIIKDPTCFKGDPPSLIDVMLVSDCKTCKTGVVIPCSLSDFHHFITGVLDIDLPRTKTRKILYRSYKKL